MGSFILVVAMTESDVEFINSDHSADTLDGAGPLGRSVYSQSG